MQENNHFSMKTKSASQSVLSMILFLLILTLVGGDYMLNFKLFGFEFYAFRLFLFFSFIYLLLCKNLILYNSRFSKYVLFAFIFWMSYALVSLLWSPNLIFGIKEIYYCLLGVMTYIVLLSVISNLENFLEKFELIWLSVYICVFSFAIIEIVTQKHLDGDFVNTLTTLGYHHNLNFVPIVTFNNPNPFASYLSLTWVISIFYLLKKSKFYLHIFVLLSSFFLITLTESRLSLIMIVVTLLLLLFLFSFKFIREKIKISFTWKTAIFFSIGATLLIIITIKFNKFNDFALTEQTKPKTEISTKNPFAKNSSSNEAAHADAKSNLPPLNLAEVSSDTVHSEIISGPDKIFLISRSLNKQLTKSEEVYLRLGNLKDFGLQSFSDNYFNEVLFFIIVFSIVSLFFIFVGYFSLKWDRKNLLYLIIGVIFFGPFIFFQHSFKHGAEQQKNAVILSSTNGNYVKKNDLIQISLNASLAEKIGRLDSVLVVNRELNNLPKEQALNSNVVRKNLILNGFDFLRESNYFGVGAGGFRELNSQKRGKRPTGQILGAHNFITEILVQYGVIVFSVGLLIFGYILWFLVKSFYRKKWSAEHTLSLLLLICIVITGNNNSTFLSLPLNWLTLILFLLNSIELVRSEKG